MASTRIILSSLAFLVCWAVVSCSVPDQAVEGRTDDCLTVTYCPRTATVCTDGALVEKVLADMLVRLGRAEQVALAQAENRRRPPNPYGQFYKPATEAGTHQEPHRENGVSEAELSVLNQQSVNHTDKRCCEELQTQLTQSADLTSKIKDDLCGASPSLGMDVAMVERSTPVSGRPTPGTLGASRT
ncbi:hypothetical protein Bbelb_140940 [Branchiostoma belcheri]|nr:hypothetical protein Bbelb_140940 [Branchiostoma belcheri]